MTVCFDGILAPLAESVKLLREAVPGYSLAVIEGLARWDGPSLECGSFSYLAGGDKTLTSHMSAPARFVLEYGRIDPEMPARGLLNLLGGEGVEGYFNPLSWKTISPVKAETAGCIQTGWGPLAPPGLEPLNPAATSRCLEALPARRAQSRMAVAGVLEAEGTLSRLATWNIYKLGGGWEAYENRGSILLYPGESELSLKSRATHLKIKMLYISTFHEPLDKCRFSSGSFEALALVLGYGRRMVSMASINGVEIELSSGRVYVSSKGPIAVAAGGVDTAFRMLAEMLVDWKPVEGPRRHFNFYSVEAHAALVEVKDEVVIKAVVLGSADAGRVHFNPPMPAREVVVEGPGGSATLMPGGPRVSIPLPPCFCGKIKIRLGRPMATRLLKARLAAMKQRGRD